MALKENEDRIGTETIADALSAIDLTKLPGWHVVHEGRLLGTYPTKDEAEMFADSHPRGEGLKVSIVEGK